MTDTAFQLGKPALVCRWRLAGRHVPLLNRHMRALSRRRVGGEPLSTNLLGWVKQHIEWSLAEDPAAVADGVLMIVVDEAGQAAMSTGAYEPLADASLEDLALRAQTAQVEASELGVAPEVLCTAEDGGITIGLSTDVPAAGATSLVEHLAQTRGIALKRDPALPFRAVSGLVGGEAFLVSDEYGIVAATNAGCAQEDAGTVAFLSAAFEKLYDAVR